MPVIDPVVVFVAGQPGAGKTNTAKYVLEQLADRGGAVVVNSDFYKPYHPDYRRLLQEDDRTAAPYVGLDGRRWMAMAERYLIERRVNIIIESTMRDQGVFLEPVATFRDKGYRVETAILAVSEAQSRLGIISRYEQMVASSGHGRLTETANHDICYGGVLDAADCIDRDRIVDVVAVYRRGNHLRYANKIGAYGQWSHPPGTRDAIEAERGRVWGEGEARQFLEEWQRVSATMPPEWHPVLQEIATLARRHLPVKVSTPSIPGAAPASETVSAATVGVTEEVAQPQAESQERWRPLADSIDSEVGRGDDWPLLAAELDRVAAGGCDVAERLPVLAADPPLPVTGRATELRYRLLAETRALTSTGGAYEPTATSSRVSQHHTPHGQPSEPGILRPRGAGR
jgi:UDP-N-acetylglucosamine kinase